MGTVRVYGGGITCVSEEQSMAEAEAEAEQKRERERGRFGGLQKSLHRTVGKPKQASKLLQ